MQKRCTSWIRPDTAAIKVIDVQTHFGHRSLRACVWCVYCLSAYAVGKTRLAANVALDLIFPHRFDAASRKDSDSEFRGSSTLTLLHRLANCYGYA